MKKLLIYIHVFFLSTCFFAQKSLKFIENKGQIYDQNNKFLDDILAVSIEKGSKFILSKQGVSHQFCRKTASRETDLNDQIEIGRLDLQWLNVKNESVFTFSKQLEEFMNFYNIPTKENGVLAVKTYQEMRLNNIYEGIDVRYYFNQGEIEYDYILKSGADYRNIQIKISGADVRIDDFGILHLKSELGEITESAPRVFQSGKELKSKWILSDKNILSFEIENYDFNQQLIIDPIVRSWATYSGGEGVESGNLEIVADNDGNSYLASSTNSTMNMVTTGAYQQVLNGTNDAILSKFDGAGNKVWSTYYGGENTDNFHSLAIQSNGDLICGGYTKSTQSIASSGAYNNTVGLWSSFMVKFNNLGQRIFGTYLVEKNDVISCDVNSDGFIIVSGSTTIDTEISTPGAYQINKKGLSDLFLMKFDPSGQKLWGTYFGGEDSEHTHRKSSFFDPFGNIFISGTTNSLTDISDLSSYQVGKNGVDDIFIAKFDANGQKLWATYYGSDVSDIPYNATADNFGNFYICGESSSSTFFGTSNTYQLENKGGYDAFISKFDTKGNLVWSTYYGDTLHEEGRSCAVDVKGNVFLAGYTDSPNMASSDGFQVTYHDKVDLFLVKFDSLGNRLWATYYGSDSAEYTGNCAVNSLGNIFLAGSTSSIADISSPSSYQENLYGKSDHFLVKFHDSDWSLGNDELSTKEILDLFPNPTTGEFYIEFPALQKNVKLKIYDLSGQIILTKDFNNSKMIEISLNETPGIYFAQIKTDDTIVTRKIIKN